MKKVIIVSPSLDTTQNVSGISAVAKFIIDNNPDVEYLHFEQGKKDKDTWGVGRFIGLLRTYREWTQFLAANKDATVHFNYPLMVFSSVRDYLFMRVARKMGMDMVVHIHGGDYLMKDKVPAMQRWCLKTVFSWDVPFIVLSELEKERLQKVYGAKNVTALPNCVDLHDAEVNPHVYPDDNAPLTFGYIGRLAKNKGLVHLLNACKIMKEKGVPFKLMFAGMEENPGEFIHLYEETLGADFEFAGVVSGEKKNTFLRKLDVFALPSFFEGLPISLLECMSYGTVPMCTPVGSIPTVVKDGENGVLLKVKDTASIVEKMQYLHEHRQEIRQMGVKARATIFEQFSPKVYIEKLNKLY